MAGVCATAGSAVARSDVTAAATLVRTQPASAWHDATGDYALLRRALESLRDAIADAADAAAYATLLRAVDLPTRAHALTEASSVLARHGHAATATELLETVLEEPSIAQVELVRRLLHVEYSSDDTQAREARSRRAAGELEGAHSRDALLGVIRRFPATAAARHARARLVRAALDDGRPAAAARGLADLRLSADPTPLPAQVGLPRNEAARALLEADCWIDAWHEDEARSLLAALRGRVAADMRVRGRSYADVLRRAAARFAGYATRTRHDTNRPACVLDPPERKVDVEAIQATRWLGLYGPGVGAWSEHTLVAEGVLPVVVRVADGARHPVGGPDQGWFGGTLVAPPSCLPDGGVLVESVVAAEPADSSGVTSGDWLLGWGGEPIQGLDHFMRRVAESVPGREIPVDVRRRGSLLLDTFRAGQRPRENGLILDYSPLWTDAAGRALLPTRRGLAWIHPAGPKRTPCWQWDGGGVVERVRVLGEIAFVGVYRRLLPDVVCAVDLTTGATRWRHEVAGRIESMIPTGSALVVGTRDPGHAHVLGQTDGRLRLRTALPALVRSPNLRAWSDRRAFAASMGYLHVLSGLGGRLHITTYDTTTGSALGDSPSFRSHRGPVVWQLDGGSLVAAQDGHATVRLVVPSVFPREPVRYLSLDANDLLVGQMHHGMLDANTRLWARGDRLYVLRIPGWGAHPIGVCVFALDRSALAKIESVRRWQAAGSAMYLEHTRTFLSGPRRDRYLLDAEPGFDGLLLWGLRFDDPTAIEAVWVAAEPDAELRDAFAENRTVTLWSASALGPRRHLPVRVGRRLFIPTDRGARVMRWHPASDHPSTAAGTASSDSASSDSASSDR